MKVNDNQHIYDKMGLGEFNQSKNQIDASRVMKKTGGPIERADGGSAEMDEKVPYKDPRERKLAKNVYKGGGEAPHGGQDPSASSNMKHGGKACTKGDRGSATGRQEKGFGGSMLGNLLGPMLSKLPFEKGGEAKSDGGKMSKGGRAYRAPGGKMNAEGRVEKGMGGNILGGLASALGGLLPFEEGGSAKASRRAAKLKD